jgi:hypothetical protein
MRRWLAGAVLILAGCTSGPTQAVGIGISAEEKDAVTRADKDCDRASAAAVTDPSNHCFIHRRAATPP